MEYQKHSTVKRRLSERRGPLRIPFGYRHQRLLVLTTTTTTTKNKKGRLFFFFSSFPTEEAMINKRLLHFLSFVYFKRGQLKIHALNVAVRRQMLRHFYSMITPLLTLHTATTATLLVVKSILRNTKTFSTINSQHSRDKVRLNSISYASASLCVFGCRSSRKTHQPGVRRSRFLPRSPKFGSRVPSLPLGGGGRSQASPGNAFLWNCAFVVVICILSSFDVP